ncbi:AraC family transcriptional regulator [Companilactobacillus halodurans]|uniref:Helix-turn-helix domain-containing protein n=1 Tax=Companilactobacillus halodurans TaxID=2584183 RepID=A0A5P0ZND5_9LACO|nr:AraC family transcriptional regulator [Companilactobacillus halodurans]MQS75696.1 helix-turn-helix domain-containing protein [Companilactobacillus halodurans]MQS97656.1 helix-turn-helix domain-containing protein [Companilactobacillus halodurans]
MPTPMELLEFDYINPIKCIYHRPIGKKYVVPHWHEAIEVTYVAKGNPGTMFIEDKKYEMHQGDVFVVNSRLIHSFDSYITKNQRIVTLLINYEWLHHCLPQTIENKTFNLIRAPKKDSQIPAFKSLVKIINEIKDFDNDSGDEYNRLHQLSIEVELISLLVKNFTDDKKVEPEIPEVISEMITDFHDNYQNEIQLSQMAKNYNYSYAYFSKFFKRYLGVSPKRYLTLLRIQKAAMLIETTDDHLGKIAADVGFPDEKSFYASFRDKYKQTPLEYRRKIRLID